MFTFKQHIPCAPDGSHKSKAIVIKKNKNIKNMSAGKINQKEYLKKYLSGDLPGQQKKKKKKKDKLPSKAT